MAKTQKEHITQAELRVLFSYREDGKLIHATNHAKVGTVAGYICANVRADKLPRVRVNGRIYYLCDLIFLHQNGFSPKYISHIDGNMSNNRIENLRKCTISKKACNKEVSKHSASIYKGVSWDSLAGKWQAKIRVSGKLIHIGQFTSGKAAAIAYDAIAKIEHGEKFKPNFINNPLALKKQPIH